MKNISTLYLSSMLLLFSCSQGIAVQKDYNEPTRINDVCFSPSHNITAYIIDKILSATNALSILVFKFDNKDIADAIIQASGIAEVRVLVDARSVFNMTDTNNVTYNCSVIDYLQNNGIDVRIYDNQPYIMHQKVIIVDRKEIVVGSANFFTNDLQHNYEFNLSFYDSVHYKKFQDDFELLWNSRESDRYEKLHAKQKRTGLIFGSADIAHKTRVKSVGLNIENATIKNVLLSHDKGKFEGFIISNLRKAKESILVQASIFLQPVIIQELSLVSRKGITVKIITNPRDMSVLKPLADAGAEIKFFDARKKGMMHNKIILIDKHVVLCGSVNMFERSLFHDVENLLKFESEDLFKVFYDSWHASWQSDDFVMDYHWRSPAKKILGANP